MTNPLANAVSAETSTHDEQRLPAGLSYLSQRLTVYKKIGKLEPEGRDHAARARAGGAGRERLDDGDRGLPGVPQARADRLVAPTARAALKALLAQNKEGVHRHLDRLAITVAPPTVPRPRRAVAGLREIGVRP